MESPVPDVPPADNVSATTALIADGDRALPLEPGQLESLPSLLRDRAFWGMNVTQLLGAFNDNLFKQLMLLLAIPVGDQQSSMHDEQGLATVVFSLPFVIFSGLAGFLADRYSKRRVIVLAKLAEILIMLLGMIGFLAYGTTGYTGLLVVLFLMGAHSTFFGPAKYGILPELFRERDLPRANGQILMTTFLAIIFGTASAGILGDWFVPKGGSLQESAHRLWAGSLICVLIALVGLTTASLVRPVSAAQPSLRLSLDSWFIPRDTLRLLRGDRPLCGALFVSCVFYLIAGIAIPAVNSLGKVQLGLSDKVTSVLAAAVGLGIAAGAVVAGLLCRGQADFRVVRAGAWGLVGCSAVLALSRGNVHVAGFAGSLPMLMLLGASAGMFAIPLQVFIQSRPPKQLKGRMIAAMNLLNFVAIFVAGGVWWLFDRLATAGQWPRSMAFAMMAGIVLPVAILYCPKPKDIASGKKDVATGNLG